MSGCKVDVLVYVLKVKHTSFKVALKGDIFPTSGPIFYEDSLFIQTINGDVADLIFVFSGLYISHKYCRKTRSVDYMVFMGQTTDS